MDLRHGLEVAGGQSSDLYKLMHRTGKNATTLRKLWDVKAHFRNHLMTEKENKLVSKIQAATANKASTSASQKKLAVIEKVANKLSGGSCSSFVQAVTAMGRNFDDEDMFGPVLNDSVQVPDDHETDGTVKEVAVETVEMVSTATEEIECAVCYSLSDNLSKLDDHLDKYQVKSTFSHNKNCSCVDCVMKSFPTPLKMGKISPDEVEDITYRAGQEFAMHCHDCDGIARKDHNGKCSFCTFDTESESEGEGKQEEEAQPRHSGVCIRVGREL
jgi:hypothetical protein